MMNLPVSYCRLVVTYSERRDPLMARFRDASTNVFKTFSSTTFSRKLILQLPQNFPIFLSTYIAYIELCVIDLSMVKWQLTIKMIKIKREEKEKETERNEAIPKCKSNKISRSVKEGREQKGGTSKLTLAKK